MNADEMVTWLRGVLDDIEASASIQSFHPDHASGLSAAILARIEAERGLLDLYAMHDESRERCDQDEARRWLAYGHRFDAPGWREEWTP